MKRSARRTERRRAVHDDVAPRSLGPVLSAVTAALGGIAPGDLRAAMAVLDALAREMER